MPKLILHGPRRRDTDPVPQRAAPNATSTAKASASSKMRPDANSASRRSSTYPTSMAGTAGRTQPVSQASPTADEDTIQVRAKPAPIAIADDSDNDSPLSDLDDLDKSDVEAPKRTPFASKTQPNRPWARNGKAPVWNERVKAANDDDDMLEPGEDENVTEYEFSNESEFEDDYKDDGLDTKHYKKTIDPDVTLSDDEVITISSDSEEKDDQKSEQRISLRPWVMFTMEARAEYEKSLCSFLHQPLQNDWQKSEDYMREKDKEMQRYLEEFPLPTWVIDPQVAAVGYNEHIDRLRWRNLGIAIYGRQNIQGWNTGPALTASTGQKRAHSHMHQQMPPQVPPHLQLQTQRGPTPNGRPMQTPSMPYGVPYHGPMQATYPPPNQVLRSQPNVSPHHAHMNGMSVYAVGGSNLPPHSVPNNVGSTSRSSSMEQGLSKPRRSYHRKKTEPSFPEDPTGRAPTPPYETRPKPAERKTAIRRNARKHAGGVVFPWNRDMDFKQASAVATWDDSIYEKSTLDTIAAIQRRNFEITKRVDRESEKKMRDNINNKKRGLVPDESTELPAAKKPRSKAPGADNRAGDQYQSGVFCFASQEEHQKAMALGFNTAGDLITGALALNSHVGMDIAAQIIIYWEPGKKGISMDLEKPKFSVRDTVLTRRQLANTPILTRRAAECAIDFCPESIWNAMLLRVLAEAGLGNKETRDRICANGFFIDKATITKRIGAALGQKQSVAGRKSKTPANNFAPSSSVVPPQEQDKVNGYFKGEIRYYDENVVDYRNYTRWFGKGSTQRSVLDLDGAESDDDGNADDIPSSDAMDESADEAGETSAEPESDPIVAEESDDQDAVSVQSDTLLDEMDDD